MTSCPQVLVATGSSNQRRLIARMLRRSGRGALPVESAEQALDAARRCTFEAIITDMHLPDCCGATMLAALRAEGVSTPALLLVEEETPRVREVARTLGATRCLCCPDLDGLEAAICSLRSSTRS
ncbi:MAG: response regulator [Deltaproteobacteria bacterium]|nr:response regulator [Deltaproteobacteria bacterium]